MIHKKAEEQTWSSTSYDGVQMCGLRQKRGGGAVLLKVAKGARDGICVIE